MSDATTAPVVGEMVKVVSEFATEETAPPPEPQSDPVPVTTPDVLTCKHWIMPVIGVVIVPVNVGEARGAFAAKSEIRFVTSASLTASAPGAADEPVLFP